MTSFSGVVENVNVARRNSKKTGKPFNVYNVMVGGQWFQYGFNKPTFVVGDTIEFEYDTTAYGNEFAKGKFVAITPGAAGGPAPAAAPAAPTPAPFPKGGDGKRKYEGTFIEREFPLGELHPDRSIVRQNMLSHATTLVTSQDFGEEEPTLQEKVRLTICVARDLEEYATGYDIVKEIKAEDKERK